MIELKVRNVVWLDNLHYIYECRVSVGKKPQYFTMYLRNWLRRSKTYLVGTVRSNRCFIHV